MARTHSYLNGREYDVKTGRFYYNLHGQSYEPYGGQYKDSSGKELDGYAIVDADYIVVPRGHVTDPAHKSGYVVLKSIDTQGGARQYEPDAQTEINRLNQVIASLKQQLAGAQAQIANMSAYQIAPAPVVEPSVSGSEIAVPVVDEFTDQLEAAVEKNERQKVAA